MTFKTDRGLKRHQTGQSKVGCKPKESKNANCVEPSIPEALKDHDYGIFFQKHRSGKAFTA